MVYFQCDTCNETLKKKQVLTHYSYQCRSAHSFSCLTCFKHFDRNTIVPHTSCITEEEKYTKGDSQAQKKKSNIVHNLKDNIDELDFKDIAWKGFSKTSKNIISLINVRKITIERLVKELSKIYSKYKNVDIEEVDEKLMKEHLMDKIENNDKFVLDLGKGLIRLK
jgi:hypothetical protein